MMEYAVSEVRMCADDKVSMKKYETCIHSVDRTSARTGLDSNGSHGESVRSRARNLSLSPLSRSVMLSPN